jgi:hypothetical protein
LPGKFDCVFSLSKNGPLTRLMPVQRATAELTADCAQNYNQRREKYQEENVTFCFN